MEPEESWRSRDKRKRVSTICYLALRSGVLYNFDAESLWIVSRHWLTWVLRERLTDDEKNTSPLIRNSSIQAHSNGITSTVDQMGKAYQTDIRVRQRRIRGCDPRKSWNIGHWVRRNNTYNVIHGRADRTSYLLDIRRLFEWNGTPWRRDLEDVERVWVWQSVRRTKVNARLRLERVRLVVLEDC